MPAGYRLINLFLIIALFMTLPPSPYKRMFSDVLGGSKENIEKNGGIKSFEQTFCVKYFAEYLSAITAWEVF